MSSFRKVELIPLDEKIAIKNLNTSINQNLETSINQEINTSISKNNSINEELNNVIKDNEEINKSFTTFVENNLIKIIEDIVDKRVSLKSNENIIYRPPVLNLIKATKIVKKVKPLKVIKTLKVVKQPKTVKTKKSKIIPAVKSWTHYK